jgi:hypothetical protein
MRYREETAGEWMSTLNEKDPGEKEYFPYGMSPLAKGWYYCELSWRLVRDTGQHHHQFGDNIMSSRPALMLRDWAYQEHLIARDRAREVFGEPPYEAAFWGQLTKERREALSRRRKTADLIRETRYHYEAAARLFERAIADYEAHINRVWDLINVNKGFRDEDDLLYRRHIQNAWFDRQVILGNLAAFDGMCITYGLAPGTLKDAADCFARAETHYRDALGDNGRYDPKKEPEWRTKPDIGMTRYNDAHLPTGPAVQAELRKELLDDIDHYRRVCILMKDCRIAAREHPDAPVSGIFTPKVNDRIKAWVILRDPPKPMGT